MMKLVRRLLKIKSPSLMFVKDPSQDPLTVTPELRKLVVENRIVEAQRMILDMLSKSEKHSHAYRIYKAFVTHAFVIHKACQFIDWELSVIRWLILNKFAKGSQMLPTIIRLREAKERIQHASSNHTTGATQ